MSDSSLHTSQEMSTWYESRGLENNFPALVQYLYPGAEVLDVGCGPGTVTVDVGKAVAPGNVIGIDTESALVEKASNARKQAAVSNVRFLVADAYALPFKDQSFDLTYTRDVFHFLEDPVAALIEQKRVTKPDGTILAFAVDWGTLVSYPDLPTVRRVVATWRLYPNRGDLPLFIDLHVGSKLYSYFTRAGIHSVTIQGVYQHDYCVTAGSERFEQWYSRLRMHFDTEGIVSSIYSYCFERGLIDRVTVVEALGELESWYCRPDAFMAVGYFLAAGHPGNSHG